MAEKIPVSSDWPKEQRQLVHQSILADYEALTEEEVSMRKTCRWEAPYFAENKRKRENLLQLMHFVLHAPAGFLQDNFDKFSEYVEIT